MLVDITSTSILQVPTIPVEAGMMPLAKLMLVEPGTAVAVPLQVLLKLFGLATFSPGGKLSVKVVPVAATLLLLNKSIETLEG